MKTFAEVADWCVGARAQFGDPAIPVAHIFLRYVDDVDHYNGRCEELIFDVASHDELRLLICGGLDPHPISISAAIGPVLHRGMLMAFGVKRIAPGFWALTPSLNLPGFLHAFVTLYGVPDPAPWEST